jgi:hypothetical protein
MRDFKIVSPCALPADRVTTASRALNDLRLGLCPISTNHSMSSSTSELQVQNLLSHHSRRNRYLAISNVLLQLGHERCGDTRPNEGPL